MCRRNSCTLLDHVGKLDGLGIHTDGLTDTINRHLTEHSQAHSMFSAYTPQARPLLLTDTPPNINGPTLCSQHVHNGPDQCYQPMLHHTSMSPLHVLGIHTMGPTDAINRHPTKHQRAHTMISVYILRAQPMLSTDTSSNIDGPTP